jgi:5-(carboxyamino)imidazole ribonucleotide mutase
MNQQNKKLQVAVVMGSQSDWETMRHACDILKEFEIEFDAQVLSAHRMPLQMNEFAKNAYDKGLRAIIAGAGGAAHLPGMIAAQTIVPVFGVPVASKHLQGVDSLHSIVQMPKGVPVACFAIGVAGAANAALQVIAMLAMFDENLAKKLNLFRQKQTEMAQNMILPRD